MRWITVRRRTKRTQVRTRRSAARWLRASVWVGLVGLTSAIAAAAWVFVVYPRQPGPGQGRVVALEIQDGEDLAGLSQRLADEGLLKYPRVWSVYARARGAAGKLRHGRVRLSDRMPPRSILLRVARGFGSAPLMVSLPEGWTRFEVARRLAHVGIVTEQAFLSATEDRHLLTQLGIEAPSAEGYLFPETYEFYEGTLARGVVRRMVNTGRRRRAQLYRAHPQRLADLNRRLRWTRHDVLTLASVVEREAAIPRERPLVAGVFLNRLMSPMFRPKYLQADPTVAYGCLVSALLSCDGFDGSSISRAMLQDTANPYNTYQHAGLPPGPICNPGEDALEAVLAPARHDFLYFVAKGDGSHAFSRELEEHQRAVARYRR